MKSLRLLSAALALLLAACGQSGPLRLPDDKPAAEAAPADAAEPAKPKESPTTP